MGLRTRFPFALLPVFIVPIAFAAPQLRLSQTAVGPLPIAAGTSGRTQTVEAFNAGDGQLNLQVRSSASWLVPSVGASRACSNGTAGCLPVNLELRTASLAAGSYTGVVTVSDPNALDAPQTITVTVAPGGTVPERLAFYLPPNGSSTEVRFNTSGTLQTAATTQSGGAWLAIAREPGSFGFGVPVPFRIAATHISGLAEGSYTGQVTTSGSAIAAENRMVPVTLQVTSQPIPQPAPERLMFRIAAGAAKQLQYIAIRNRGLGTLSVTGAAAATTSGGNWLSSTVVSGQNLVGVTADPASVGPGTYQGSVTVTTNGVGGDLRIPVDLEVVAESAPVSFFRGLVNNATFEPGDQLAQGTIVALFGEQFTTGEAQVAASLPLENSLSGTRVLVNDRPAPVYYLSPGQINFQIPYETAEGDAVVRVERGGQRGNGVSARIVRYAPRLLRLGIADYAIAVNEDRTFPMPAAPGIGSRPARSGDTLVFYALGLGPADPPVQSGVASPSGPLAASPGYTVAIGTPNPFGAQPVEVVPLFAGLTPGFVGLYQINVTIPAQVERGTAVPVQLYGNGTSSNRVTIAIE